MNISTNTPAAIAEALGERLQQARLNQDKTQAEVAERAGVSTRTVLNAEKGNVRLEALVAVLAALDLTGQLDLFLPEQDVSPIQLSRLKGKVRRRASGQRKAETEGLPVW